MKLADLVLTAWDNLLRLKLRTALTVAGVVIAIGAFVAMISFGAGNQRLVTEQYHKFGLLFTMQVFPGEADADSLPAARLDDSAVALLGRLPGIRLAYALEDFPVQARLADTALETRVQGLSPAALRTRQYARLAAGTPWSSDTARAALITSEFARKLGVTQPDSAVGRPLEITVRLITLDSAVVRLFRDRQGRLHERFRDIHFDSLVRPHYLRRTARTEFAAAVERFLGGLLNERAIVHETLTVTGVLEPRAFGGPGRRGLFVPRGTAALLTAGGLSESPTELFAELAQGHVPGALAGSDDRFYRRVTLDLEPSAPYARVRDTVEALGFRTFSFAEQFEEIRQFFFYFDVALGLVGLIALVTAALGIANTLLMAIVERRREIGVLKSLGAHDHDIRMLFFMESAVIGTVGALLGIGLGWLVSRLGSIIARAVMESRGIQPVDFFAVPWWLAVAALGVGVGVSVMAGFFPASRAARLDPVQCLRAD